MRSFNRYFRCFVLLALLANGLGLERIAHAAGASSVPHCHHVQPADSNPAGKHGQRVGSGCFCGSACSCGCTLLTALIVEGAVVGVTPVPAGVETIAPAAIVPAVLHPLLRPPIV